jgi:hypothetical protein
MVVEPPADSIPDLTDSATDEGRLGGVRDSGWFGLTLGNVAVHGVDDDCDSGGHVGSSSKRI